MRAPSTKITFQRLLFGHSGNVLSLDNAEWKRHFRCAGNFSGDRIIECPGRGLIHVDRLDFPKIDVSFFKELAHPVVEDERLFVADGTATGGRRNGPIEREPRHLYSNTCGLAIDKLRYLCPVLRVD